MPSWVAWHILARYFLSFTPSFAEPNISGVEPGAGCRQKLRQAPRIEPQQAWSTMMNLEMRHVPHVLHSVHLCSCTPFGGLSSRPVAFWIKGQLDSMFFFFFRNSQFLQVETPDGWEENLIAATCALLERAHAQEHSVVRAGSCSKVHFSCFCTCFRKTPLPETCAEPADGCLMMLKIRSVKRNWYHYLCVVYVDTLC